MKVYKITSATKPFMKMFNNYYDYEYKDGEFVSDRDYESLKSEVEHFNHNVAFGPAIKIEKAGCKKSGKASPNTKESLTSSLEKY